MSLKYIVWLGIHHRVDASPTPAFPTTFDRLDALLAAELAWTTFSPRYFHWRPNRFDSLMHAAYDGFVQLCDSQYTILLINLPSVLSGRLNTIWHNVNFPTKVTRMIGWTEYRVEAENQLLIFESNVAIGPKAAMLRLRWIFDAEREHPLTRHAQITPEDLLAQSSFAPIRSFLNEYSISGETLLIEVDFVDSNSNGQGARMCIVAWNWIEGKIVARLVFPTRSNGPDHYHRLSWGTLGSSTLVVALYEAQRTKSDALTLRVYDLSRRNDDKDSFFEPLLLREFLIPTFGGGHVDFLQLVTGDAPGASPVADQLRSFIPEEALGVLSKDSKPFLHPGDKEDKLCVISVRTSTHDDIPSLYTFVFFAQTLFAHYDSPTMSWDAWGTKHAACLFDTASTVDEIGIATFGARLARTRTVPFARKGQKVGETAEEKEGIVQLFDFNQLRARRLSREGSWPDISAISTALPTHPAIDALRQGIEVSEPRLMHGSHHCDDLSRSGVDSSGRELELVGLDFTVVEMRSLVWNKTELIGVHIDSEHIVVASRLGEMKFLGQVSRLKHERHAAEGTRPQVT
ncbi:hypothetical protein DL93DRAFT_2179751 [Clavulina sp. PMI_390]|nr:hypothetical protein DL93DRAFT_2179751 [Clavulina sp. PMI_390]